jgi:hypothetical protein
VRPKDHHRLRFVAWACVLVVLLAAASPSSGGLPPAILAPPAPGCGEPAAITILLGDPGTPPTDLVVLGSVPARAPPLA